MAKWRAQLFGTFALYRDDELIDVPASISKSLVAYLLLARSPVSREVLTANLWPDLAVADARNTLSQAIWKFKSAVGDQSAAEFLDVGQSWIAVRADISVDVSEFEDLLDESRSRSPAERDSLFEATQLYRGDLLAGLFDDWITVRQAHYRMRVADALDRLQRLHAAGGDFANSLEFLRRLVAIDPLRSDAHRQIMKTLHLLGRREEAMSYFEAWDAMLGEEFERNPSRESRELYRVIAASPEMRVPADSSGFVGRESELRQALSQLEASLVGVGILMPVVGEIGVGKSAFLRRLQGDLYWRGLATVYRSCSGDSEHSFGTAAGLIRTLLSSSTAAAVGAMVPRQLIQEAGRLVPELLDHFEISVPFMTTVDDPAMRTREAIISVVAALASARPTVLLVDDLHDVDLDSMALLGEMVERLVKVGAGVVIALPPHVEVAVDYPHDFVEMIENVDSIRLPRFDLQTTDAYVREIRRALVETSVVQRLHTESGGLPVFLSLLVRDMEGPSGSLVAVIENRIESLRPELRRILDALSLDRIGMDAQHLSAVVADWRDEIEELMSGGIVIEDGGRFRIELDAVRDAVYRSALTVADLHASFARALAETEEELARFARHASAAGLNQTSALAYYVLAKDARSVNGTATAVGAYEEAIAAGREGGLDRESLFAVVAEYVGYLSAYSLDPAQEGLDDLLLDLARGPSEEREALLRVTELHRVRGAFEECIEMCARGIELSNSPDQVAEFALERVMVRQLQGNVDVGLSEVNEILELDAINPEIRARLAQARSHLFLRLSRFEEMRDSLDEALVLSGNDVLIHTDVLNVIALRTMEAGQLLDSIAQQEEIFELAAQAGYRYRMAVSKWNTAIAYLNLDQMVESIEAAEEAVRIGTEIGSVYLSTMGRLSLASALFETAGPSERVDELLSGAQLFGKRHNVTNARWWAEELIALVRHRRGDLLGARSLIDQTVQVWEERGVDWGVLNARLSRVQMSLADGRIDDAREDIVVAADKSSALESATHPMPIKAMRSLALASSGELDAAATVAHEVLEGEMTWYSQHRSFKYVADALKLAGDPEGHVVAIDLARERFEARLQGASRALTERARRSPEAIEILEAWMLAAPRRLNVTLANASGPIDVEWTLSSPTDGGVEVGIARRRHRLGRVLAQSRAAGVESVPVTELSTAFSVSDSTIRRDLDALSAHLNSF